MRRPRPTAGSLRAVEGPQEPLEDRDRGRGRGPTDVPGLRPDDVGAVELDRRLVRDAERRGDLFDPGRLAPAPARGDRRTGLGLEVERHQPARGRGGGPHHYTAADYDELVDSPIYAGNPSLYEFEVDGVPHVLLNEGEGGLWDGPRSARDVETIVRTQKAFWGSLPYKKYVFFNLLTESGGGPRAQELDGADVQPMGDPDALELPRLAEPRQPRIFPHLERQAAAPGRAGPVRLRERGLHAEPLGGRGDHQLLRPPAGPPRRALHAVDEYLAGDPPHGSEDKPINEIERLQTTPGRLVQPLEDSSFDAWIKFYRRDENTPNTTSATTSRGPSSPSCSTPRSARRPVARRASTT